MLEYGFLICAIIYGIIFITCWPCCIFYHCAIRFSRLLHKSPTPSWFGFFLDSYFRKAFENTQQVLNRLDLKNGRKVLQIGCGSGCYTIEMSKKVGKNGKIFALDLQEKMLDQLKKKIKKAKLKDDNIEIVCADASKLPFADETFDVVTMTSTICEMPDPVKVLKEARRVLKKNISSYAVVSEHAHSMDYPLMSTTKKNMSEAGFKVVKVYGNFWSYSIHGIVDDKKEK